MVPVMDHQLVRRHAAKPIEVLLIHRLYQYLHFTAELEAVAVIPVTTSLSLGRSGLDVPVAMRADAFKITTDEAWHAQFSYDLVHQVRDETNVIPRLPRTPQFVQKLDLVRDTIGPGLDGLCDLLFATVSETLISSLLSDIPKDIRVRSTVREVVADHAEDEGKHHSYFRSLLTFLWPAMTQRERRLIGPVVPKLIQLFLEPDYTAVAHSLLDVGVPAREVEQVLTESYPSEVVARDIALAARSTVRYFADVGALGDPATHDAFLTAGMLTG
jgi:hypothetical protein